MNFGEKINLGGLLVSLAGCATIAVLNYRGTHSFIQFSEYPDDAVPVDCLLHCRCGAVFRLGPTTYSRCGARAGGGSWLIGIAWIFGNAPMMFNSFQSVLQAIEERTRSLWKKMVVRLCILSVLLVMIFYLLIVVAAARATPWAVLASSDLAAAERSPTCPGPRRSQTVFLLALAASLS